MGRSERVMWIFKTPRWLPTPMSIEDCIIVVPLSKYLNNTKCMLAVRDLVNRRNSMIVVVGWYPTISLEMYTGVVYKTPTDSIVWGIMWKMCTRDKWNLDWPYDTVVKSCHTCPVRGYVYVMLVPLHGCLLIQISATLSDLSDSLFTAPLVVMQVT
jgi:hypothetical protein